MQYEGQNAVDHDGVVSQPFRQSPWGKKADERILEEGQAGFVACPCKAGRAPGRVELQPWYRALLIQETNGQICRHMLKRKPYS